MARIDGMVVLALGFLVLVFYGQIALTNQMLPGVDAFTYFAPYRQYAAEVVCGGRLPLWNPYLFMGVPFIGNAQTAVFYPLNALLCWLDGPRLVVWSIVIHVFLAATFAYLYARRVLALLPPAAFLGACVFACGGFLSGMVEHVNQLNVSAWFPLYVVLWERGKAREKMGVRAVFPFVGLLGVVVGVGLLAGHTQSTYICLFGLAAYALPSILVRLTRRRASSLGYVAARLWRSVWQFGLVVLIAVALAAVQLLPTMELSALSIRGGGLSYAQAVAFSLKPLPRLLRYTFLPPLGKNLADVYGGDFYTEYVAYVGFIPLLLVAGWAARSVLASRGGKGHLFLLRTIDVARPEIRLLILAGLGLFLAFGGYNPLYWVLFKLVPGFGLFRAPARWLFLYAFGIAMLVGVAWQRLFSGTNRSPWSHKEQIAASRPRLRKACSFVALVALGVALAELFVASRSLPLAHPTAPEAFSSLRTAPAHILAAQGQEPMPGRVLSMSDILFDPGDRAEMQQIYGGQLDDKALYDLVVSAKRKEILAPNLPLSWRIYAVDGYDGGVLPLQRYVDLQTLLLPREQISPDGRLRENLSRIPSTRLLSLFGVRYVITDKVYDAWIDGVFYDLAFESVLQPGAPTVIETDMLPAFEANALGIIANTDGPVTENGLVAELRLYAADRPTPFVLPVHAGRESENGSQPRARRLHWDQPVQIERLEIQSQSTLHVRGLTLIDERDGSSVPLLLPGDGRVRLAHSGDVKVYEFLDALPRAYVVHEAALVEDEQEALGKLADPAFDVANKVLLHSQANLPWPNIPPDSFSSSATVNVYQPERVAVDVVLAAPGCLVLTDAYYPGWKATVDGKPAEILRANVHFRAVCVQEGAHHIELVYRPTSFYVGLGISLLAVGGVLAGLATTVRRDEPEP